MIVEIRLHNLPREFRDCAASYKLLSKPWSFYGSAPNSKPPRYLISMRNNTHYSGNSQGL